MHEDSPARKKQTREIDDRNLRKRRTAEKERGNEGAAAITASLRIYNAARCQRETG
jgi:hypothetical protein